jgi:Flp pilus assembly pilin Flp
MNNLVEKFAPAEADKDDEGVVSIEYVVMAGAVIVGLVGVFTGAWTALGGKLTSLIGTIA